MVFSDMKNYFFFIIKTKLIFLGHLDLLSFNLLFLGEMIEPVFPSPAQEVLEGFLGHMENLLGYFHFSLFCIKFYHHEQYIVFFHK